MLKASPQVHGFQIPGLHKRVLISLFADDTALYLSEHDRYDVIKQILDEWCRATGAKFNINKTEIIPIGKPAARTRTINARKINPLDREALPPGIHIAVDGVPIRYLGAWIGNNVDDAEPWERTLDKMRNALHGWQMGHPTLQGKRTIVQAIIGGTTQFLTKVQGMPPNIEDAVIKEIRTFIWPDCKSAAIALDYLYNPANKGGIGLLDIKARNEAIEI
ncbi:hypothetical protein DENSPDRAFT_747484, partial [Dentipellis sp. KUC8613]